MGAENMRDLYQILRQKELDIERIRREIEALQSVIPLLSDDIDRGEKGRPAFVSTTSQSRRNGGVAD